MNPTSQSYAMPVVCSYLSLLAQWRNDENFTEHHLVTCWITKEFVNNTVIIQFIVEITFPWRRDEIVDAKIIPRVFQSSRSEYHICHQLKLLEFIFELPRAASAPWIENQPAASDFTLPEEQKSNLGGSMTLIRTVVNKKNKMNLKNVEPSFVMYGESYQGKQQSQPKKLCEVSEKVNTRCYVLKAFWMLRLLRYNYKRWHGPIQNVARKEKGDGRISRDYKLRKNLGRTAWLSKCGPLG